MDFYGRTVDADVINLDIDHVAFLQRCKNTIQHAVFRPAIRPRIDRVPIAEAFRQSSPLAPMFGDVQDRIDNIDVFQSHVPALGGEQIFDHFEARS